MFVKPILPIHEGIMSKKWGKEDELKQLKSDLAAIDRKIQAEIAPKPEESDGVENKQMRNSSNSLRHTDTYVHDYKFGSNIFANLPLGFYIKTDLTCSFRSGTFIEKGRDDQILWIFHISKTFLKNNNLELCASWHDILAQRKNLTINSTPYGYGKLYESDWFILSCHT